MMSRSTVQPNMPGVFFLLTLPMGWRQAKLGFRYVCVNTPGPVGPVVSEHTHARQVRLFFFFPLVSSFLGDRGRVIRYTWIFIDFTVWILSVQKSETVCYIILASFCQFFFANPRGLAWQLFNSSYQRSEGVASRQVQRIREQRTAADRACPVQGP